MSVSCCNSVSSIGAVASRSETNVLTLVLKTGRCAQGPHRRPISPPVPIRGPPLPGVGPPGLTAGPGVSMRHPTGVPHRDPLNHPYEPSTQPATRAASVLRALPEPWAVNESDVGTLVPGIEAALTSGWTPANLIQHLSRSPAGVRSPGRVLARRLADLPSPPTRPAPHAVPWCGECEDARSRTITVTMPDGTEAAAFCPRCSPQAQHRPRDPIPTDQVNEGEYVGGKRIQRSSTPASCATGSTAARHQPRSRLPTRRVR